MTKNLVKLILDPPTLPTTNKLFGNYPNLSFRASAFSAVFNGAAQSLP